jgi:hypothetical protein
VRRSAATALLLLALPAPAAAQPQLPTGPDLEAAGWRPLLFQGREATLFQSAGERTIRIEAQGSSSMLSAPLRVDTSRYRCLSWRWSVDETTLGPTDLGKRGGDDRHLIVSLGFAFEPDKAGIGERMRHALARQHAGRDVPGRVLFYVWGGDHPRGAWIKSPYMDGAGFIRVVEPAPGPRARWLEVTVDYVADFEARFARPAPEIVELAIGGDTDDTRTRSIGRIADLAIKERC